jgi:hypothetical protein
VQQKDERIPDQSEEEMTPEGKVKSKLDRELRKRKPHVWWFKPVSNGMGKHGVPDYICCVRGQFFGIECKAYETSEPTKHQKIQLAEIGAADGKALVCHIGNIHEILAIIDMVIDRGVK